MCYDSKTFLILEIGQVEITLHQKMLEAYQIQSIATIPWPDPYILK